MAKKQKSKNKNQVPIISPASYVKEKGRALPVGPCYSSRENTGINEETGLYQLVVTRAKPSGKFLVGIYLVDVWCLGVKYTTFRPNFDEDELQELLEQIGSTQNGKMFTVDYAWAHRLIFDSVDYADTLGFAPDKDFALTRYILEPKEAIEEDFGFTFGKDGRPFLMVGPYDNGLKLIGTLRRTVGDGNFDYIMPISDNPLLEDDW